MKMNDSAYVVNLIAEWHILLFRKVFRQKLHRSFKNIKVVSNRMVFNEEGRLVAFKGGSFNHHEL